MSDWATKHVDLTAPYDGKWIEVFEDPPLGLYLELRRLLRGIPDEKSLNRALSLVRQMVADHNLVAQDGERLDIWSTATVGSKLIKQLTDALKSVIDDEGGGSADPLTPTTSPSTSSKARRSRRTSASGS